MEGVENDLIVIMLDNNNKIPLNKIPQHLWEASAKRILKEDTKKG